MQDGGKIRTGKQGTKKQMNEEKGRKMGYSKRKENKEGRIEERKGK